MGVKEYQFAGDEIQKHLNKVFKPAVVEFEITHADFKMSELTSFSHGGSHWNSVYNDDQKTVLRAYDSRMVNGVYYLFFIDNVTDKKDGNGTMVSGYMPRGYNAGFIYDKGSPHTIAHKLGHGIAGLEHVFSDSKSSGKTKNLMDYADGTQLWHFQWDEIQDPSRVWMKWNKDESEGENQGPIDDLLVWIMWHSYDFVKRLSKDEFYKLCEPNNNIPFWECVSSKGELQDDEFSNNLHHYSKEQIISILQAKENILINNGKVNDWKSNLDILYNCSEEQLKSYYKIGKPLSESDILFFSPAESYALAKHLYRTMGTVLALSEPYESDVINLFFDKNLPKNTVLSYDENTDLSKKLHYNYNFHSDFYFDKVVKYIYINFMIAMQYLI